CTLEVFPSPQSIVTNGLRPTQPPGPQLDVVNPPTVPENVTPAVALNAFGGGVAPAVETPPASEPTMTATTPASRVITTRHLLCIDGVPFLCVAPVDGSVPATPFRSDDAPRERFVPGHAVIGARSSPCAQRA